MSETTNETQKLDWPSQFQTYNWDLPLLRELGLQPFRGKVWQEVFVGKVSRDDALIFIWVTGAPAQFWRFEIVDFGNYETHTVTTGSGSLRDHWPHVERIAEGMLGVTSASFDPKKKLPAPGSQESGGVKEDG